MTPAGDGNGILNYTGDCVGIYSGAETTQAWYHLQKAGYIDEGLTGNQRSYCGGTDATADNIGPRFADNDGTKIIYILVEVVGLVVFFLL